jgi:small glutamine-rich tetratricopeptide repeat-containing protein alpha
MPIAQPSFLSFYRHAQYSLGDFQAALSAFERGLKIDPTNASLKSGVQNAQARIVPDDEGPPPLVADDGLSATSSTRAPAAGAAPGMGGMADMLRGMGGLGGGGGGMPDIASLMNNPQMMAMAQQMAANGGLASLMQNPAVANMVRADLLYPAVC